METERNFEGEERTEAENAINQPTVPEDPIEQTELTSHRKKHEDHSVSRKYRMFSNHSSAGDMPHTNTSI